jgi:hypothetical protein
VPFFNIKMGSWIRIQLHSSSTSQGLDVSTLQTPIKIEGSVCKVRTQDPENLDEEVKSLVTAWRIEEPSEINLLLARFHSPGVTKDLTLGFYEKNRVHYPLKKRPSTIKTSLKTNISRF